MSEYSLAYIHQFTADLSAPLKVKRLPDAAPVGDSNAHLFRVLMNGAMPENALAYACRPDGVTVVCPCEMEEDAVSFALPPNAMCMPGQVEILLRGMAGDCVTTLLWCSLTVLPGVSQQLADPEAVIPSLQELLLRVEECRSAAGEAQSAAGEAFTAADECRAAARQSGTKAEEALQACAAMAGELGSVSTALAGHGSRLTALEGRVSPDDLAAMFCPAFQVSGSLITCWPAPGTTVMLETTGEGVAFRTSGRALWSGRDMVGGDNYYYITGSDSGDVAVPAGSWVFSWSFQGVGKADSYSVYYRIGTGTAQRKNTYGPEGSLTLNVTSPTVVSIWLVKTAAGWAGLGYPSVTAMLADASMQEAGFMTHTACVQAASSFISHGVHEPVLVWTEDGSSLTARGLEDLPHALAGSEAS